MPRLLLKTKAPIHTPLSEPSAGTGADAAAHHAVARRIAFKVRADREAFRMYRTILRSSIVNIGLPDERTRAGS